MTVTEIEAPLKEITEIAHDLVANLVSNPRAVRITPNMHGPLAAFSIKTEQVDVRRVLGAKGRHFRAISAIVSMLSERVGLESLVTIDERESNNYSPSAFITPPPRPYRADQWLTVTNLLEAILEFVVNDSDALTIKTTDYGLTTVAEVQVSEEDYPLVYGLDGEFIEALKSVFGGIAGNHGRAMRIVLTQVAE